MLRKFTTKIPGFICVIFLLGFGLQNCKNPFSTREPESPQNQQRTNWIQPTNARDVLTNMRYAIQDRNLTNYLSCFNNSGEGNSFRYQPDQNARIRYPGVWDAWGLEHEKTYITNVFSAIPKDSVSSLIYLGEGIENPQPDSTIIIREYELTLGHTRDSHQYPRKARGRAEFYLKQNTDGYWAIYFWIDDGFEEAPSWSDVKATFIQ